MFLYVPAMQVLPEAIRHLRERSGLSLTALADRARISKHTLWKIEHGLTPNARPATIKAIADGLDVPIVAITTTSVAS